MDTHTYTPGEVDTHLEQWTHTHTPGAVDTHTHLEQWTPHTHTWSSGHTHTHLEQWTHTHTHTWSSGHTHTPGAVDTHTHTHTHTHLEQWTHTHTGAVDTHTHTHTHTRLAAIDGDGGYTGVKPQHRYVTYSPWHRPPDYFFFIVIQFFSKSALLFPSWTTNQSQSSKTVSYLATGPASSLR